MPHVTFVHGLSNKPEPNTLLSIWNRALSSAGGLDLTADGVTYSMLYWADVLYPSPDVDESVADYESTQGDALARADGTVPAELSTIQIDSEAEAKFVERLHQHFTSASFAQIDSGDVTAAADPGAVALERVPLPWFIKKRIMKAFLRDAHHYYFNKPSSPRPDTSFMVQDEIRRRFIQEIDPAKNPALARNEGPHIVVAHSMGTMIAYDCLQRVANCPRIDGLMTLGSPLGIDEVQDCNKPEWSRDEGFPGQKIAKRWVNVFDRLDVVCAADPRLASDFRFAGKERIEDIGVSNEGPWRHAIVKYLGQARVREALASMLEL